MMKLFQLLRSGVEVANAAKLSNRKALIDALVGFLSALLAISPALGAAINAAPEDVVSVAGGLAAVWLLGSAYFRAATDSRVGLQSPPSGDGGHSDNGSPEASGSGGDAAPSLPVQSGL